DYVFDLARFTRFDGKAGPYLQYAAVRIRSIVRKADDDGFSRATPVIRTLEERRLLLLLLGLPDAMALAETRRAPNVLCDYVFSLAQEFSRFYTAHHILSETDAALRAARLGLCDLTLRVLVKVLVLVG